MKSFFPEAGNIYYRFEADPKYLVREIARDEEATQFVKEMENK